MRTLRLCLLLCLAVLLPIRGAMAAAMLCPMAKAAMQAELQAGGHCDHHDMAGESASQPNDDGKNAPSEKCHFCMASCSMASLVGQAPRLPEPAALPGMRFAEVATPAPDFLSSGPERPPRSR